MNYIITTANKQYLPHFYSFAYSLVNYNKNFILFVLSDTIVENDLKELKNELLKGNSELQIVKIDKDIFKNFKLVEHFQVQIYFRLVMDKFLPNYINKILYMDSDIIIKDDISELFDLEIETIAASKDITSLESSKRFGLELDNYFNTGVMLVNLEKFRKENYTDSLIKLTKDRMSELIFPDQDVLNIFFPNWKKIDVKYNFPAPLFQNEKKFLRIYGNQYSELPKTENIKIIHYVGFRKPWAYPNVPFSEDYYYYLSQTKYKNLIPKFKFQSKINKYKLLFKRLLNRK